MPLPVPELVEGEATTAELVRCAFGLAEPDVRVLEVLESRGQSTTEDVATDLRKDASVVYRNLQRLVACDVVEKRRETLEGGGYRFVYVPLPTEAVKARLLACVDSWHARMREAIEAL